MILGKVTFVYSSQNACKNLFITIVFTKFINHPQPSEILEVDKLCEIDKFSYL
jgi:hypothetical protein